MSTLNKWCIKSGLPAAPWCKCFMPAKICLSIYIISYIPSYSCSSIYPSISLTLSLYISSLFQTLSVYLSLNLSTYFDGCHQNSIYCGVLTVLAKDTLQFPWQNYSCMEMRPQFSLTEIKWKQQLGGGLYCPVVRTWSWGLGAVGSCPWSAVGLSSCNLSPALIKFSSFFSFLHSPGLLWAS